jgi:hypothetical protein
MSNQIVHYAHRYRRPPLKKPKLRRRLGVMVAKPIVRRHAA